MQINIFQQMTTIFKEGQTVRQDVDYAYLHKQKLGHGTHGDVHRVWFYHPVKEVEADIVVKEVFEYLHCTIQGDLRKTVKPGFHMIVTVGDASATCPRSVGDIWKQSL